VGSWPRLPDRSCVIPWTHVQGLGLLTDDTLRHTRTQLLNQEKHTAVVRVAEYGSTPKKEVKQSPAHHMLERGLAARLEA
jgi:hypothetical protein